MITLPIWLFILSVILGFPLIIIIITIICYTVYIGFTLTKELIKVFWSGLWKKRMKLQNGAL